MTNTNLKLWERASNYSGETFEDYYQGLSRSRDSDLISESNFECALEQLGGESETVLVNRSGHWAVGWVEQILVHKSDKKAVKILEQIKKGLEDYALIDDDDYYERENEAIESDFEQYQSEFTSNAIKALNKATDVPLELLETLKNSKAFEIILRECHRESASYSGYQDAFVTEQNFTKQFESIYSDNWASSDVTNVQNQIKQALAGN